jgi:hypothetical protein
MVPPPNCRCIVLIWDFNMSLLRSCLYIMYIHTLLLLEWILHATMHDGPVMSNIL